MGKTRTRFVLILVMAGFLSVPGLRALQPDRELSQYSRHFWNTSDDLPQNVITALLQSADGYLWVGTQGGLARFDGVRFRTFDRSTSPAFTDAFVTSLTEDRRGHLWIGTRQGLLRYDGMRLGRMTTEQGLPHDYIRSLLCDSQGRLWVGTYGGGLGLLVDGEPTSFEQPDRLVDEFVRVLFEDRQGSLWIGTSQGVYRLREGRFEVFGESHGLGSEFIRAITQDGQGRIWVGTEGAGLFYLEGDRFRPYAGMLDVVSVRVLYADAEGSLWAGSDRAGLVRLRGDRQSRLTRETGLPHDSVWSLWQDREGSLWVGTRGGLVQLKDGSVTTFTAREGLQNESVRSIYQDAQGRLWVGTEGGGPQVFEEGRFVDPGLPDLLGSARVRSILQDRSGTLWLGTRIGLLGYHQGRVRRFSTHNGLPFDVVNALAEQPAGTIWIGTSGGGLSRLQGETIITLTNAQGLLSDHIRALYPSQQTGDLWIGTEAGLNRIAPGSIQVLPGPDGLDQHFVLAIMEDSSGNLWLGTAGGLFLWNGERVVDFSALDGALGVTIFQILEDQDQKLWLSSPQGVLKIEKSDLLRLVETGRGMLRVQRFTEADGMLTSECAGGTQPSGWRTQDGRIWFPSLRGVVMIDPKPPLRDQTLPLPLIEEVRAGIEVFHPERPLELTPESSTLVFNFTAPSFFAPSRLRFRYRLEGFDHDWVNVGVRRSADYTNLPPGSYRFQVAVSRDGVSWGDPVSSAPIRLAPALYQTLWFRVLAALLLALAVAGLFRYRIRTLEARRRHLEEMVAERTEQLRLANQSLQELASVDDLTGLTNHRRFQEELQSEWRRGARAQRPLTLILLDIDCFKRFNDSYGHLAGDACLKSVAACLSQWVRREGEVLARYGGEEFVALLPDVSLEEGVQLAREMREAIQTLGMEHRDSTAASVVTVSAGVASAIPDLVRDPSWLFKAADSALYRAKHSGRNRVEAEGFRRDSRLES